MVVKWCQMHDDTARQLRRRLLGTICCGEMVIRWRPDGDRRAMTPRGSCDVACSVPSHTVTPLCCDQMAICGEMAMKWRTDGVRGTMTPRGSCDVACSVPSHTVTKGPYLRKHVRSYLRKSGKSYVEVNKIQNDQWVTGQSPATKIDFVFENGDSMHKFYHAS